jgi:hypothetical protein
MVERRKIGKSIWIIIYIYMEMSQRNKQKCHFFPFTKSENKSAEQVPWGRGDTSRRGKEVEKWHGKVNILQILCTHVC